jgi:hypothetical protein
MTVGGNKNPIQIRKNTDTVFGGLFVWQVYFWPTAADVGTSMLAQRVVEKLR